MHFLYNYSIIIPHKNIPTLLQRCLNSIPERRDVQIIIVDDNSDPEKVDFKQFPGLDRNNVEVYFTKEGRGAGYARNVGLMKATGKWILFADADDFYINGFLNVLDSYVNADIEILFFSVKSVFSDSLEPASRSIELQKRIGSNSNEDIDYIKYVYRAPWFKMFSHSFIKKYNLEFEEVLVGNDVMFSLISSFLCHKEEFITNALYVVTYRKDSITYKSMSISEYITKYNNILKKNQFYSYIGRPEFKTKIVSQIIHGRDYGRLNNRRFAADFIARIRFIIKSIYVLIYYRLEVYSNTTKYVNIIRKTSTI